MLLSVGLVTNVVDVNALAFASFLHSSPRVSFVGDDDVKDVNAVASKARDWEKYLGENVDDEGAGGAVDAVDGNAW